MQEFFHMGKALSFQPPAKGKNIAIITDAGGPGVMAADECESRGINVKIFSDKTASRLEELRDKGLIMQFAQVKNPIDLTGSATSEMFESVMKIIVEDGEIHGVIVIGIHHLPAIQEDFVDRTCKIASETTKPVVACDIGETEMALHIRSRFEKLGVPSYSAPEDTAQAMAALVSYGEYLQRNNCFDDYLEKFLAGLGKGSVLPS
jgi:acyl-CoA synthetase (NDP forming)